MQVESVLLDTCCLLNLCATGCFSKVLQNDKWHYALSQIVSDTEALYIQQESKSDDGGLEYIPIGARTLAAESGMQIIEVGEVSEIELYVRLAVTLDDGEAHGLAVAKKLGFCFGTDDRKAIRVASLPEVDVRIITTPQIVKHWFDTRLVTMEPRVLLSKIERYGRFRPRPDSILAEWWASFNGEAVT